MFCEFVAPINDNKGILFSKNEKIITNFKETTTINNKTIPGNSKANISSDVFEQICHHEERFAFDMQEGIRSWKLCHIKSMKPMKRFTMQ